MTVTDDRSLKAGSHRAVRVLAGVVAVVCVFLSVFAVFARDTLFDSDEAADRATEAAVTPEVRSVISTSIVDQLVAADPELLQARPILETVVDGLLQTPIYEEILESSFYTVHQAVFTNETDELRLALVDLVLLVKVSLAKIDPGLAALIPDELTDGLVEIRSDKALIDGTQMSQRVDWLAFVLPVLGFVGFVGFVALSRDRRRALVDSGVAAISIGVLVLVIEWVSRAYVLRSSSDAAGEAAGAAVWDVFAGDLIRLALIMAGAGTVLAVTAAMGLERVSLEDRGRRILSVLERPESTGGRWIWAGLISLTGLLLIVESALAVRLLVTIVGVALLINGAAEVLNLIAPDSLQVWRPSDIEDGKRSSGRWGWVVGGLATGCLLTVVLVSVARSGGDGIVERSGPGCNGSVVLCDRPLNQVALAASHNSMAAANDGFIGGYQTVGMLKQLDDGYRGFLIDTYFGLENSDGLVLTDRAPVTEEEREKMVADVGEGVVRSAEALREDNEITGGTRDVYLCHSFCEIGAVRMADEFTRIKSWLDDHEREVLIFVIQDEGPTDQDIAAVLSESGLDDMVHTQEIDEPWPTLREMIESGRRLWISAENDAGQLDWYHNAFTYVQDTPFSQPTTADFTCELYRGEKDSPLFLINHWLSPASAVSADEANSRPVLEERLVDCEDERAVFPNLIAVDFSDRGDLLAVVDDLNGVSIDR